MKSVGKPAPEGLALIVLYMKMNRNSRDCEKQKAFYGDAEGIKEVRGFFAFISALIYERKTETGNNEKGC
jgi:hypothetical protein